VVAVAIITVAPDFFLLLEEIFTEAAVVGDCDPRAATDLPPPVDKTKGRGGAGAAVFEASFDATVEAGGGSTPVERGGMEAMGSATGGRADMLESN